MITVYDFKKAASELAAANNSLSRTLHKLDYLHVVDKAVAISQIRKEEKRVYALQRKIWNLNEAESVFRFMTDELHDEILTWLKTKNIFVTPSCTTPDVVLLAVENGWELFQENGETE